MELRDGCRLNLANDEQNPKDWYLCRTQHEEGFRLRGDRSREKRRDEAADRRRGVLERMSGLEAPRSLAKADVSPCATSSQKNPSWSTV